MTLCSQQKASHLCIMFVLIFAGLDYPKQLHLADEKPAICTSSANDQEWIKCSRKCDHGLVYGSNPSSPTTHSCFLPTCGDAPKMPTNGGLIQCVLWVSGSRKGRAADFGPQSPRQKIPFLAPERALSFA